jgi:two-component system, response regulator, stage 0 sporulation protein F
MSNPCILLVDDQRDIVRLLHSTLQTLGHALDIVDAPSGEEALLEASRRKVDLLVADYLLPGISGVELMRKIKARNPDMKVIFITGTTDRKFRDEMLNGGAIAIFDKPIPLADFLDSVERGLGLVRTIFPMETAKETEQHRQTLSELLGGFRQKIKADAVFLINDRGRVLARAGDLYDSSMEVSLLAALMGIYSAGFKVSRIIRQEHLDNFHVFRGGDHDLILIPVDGSHALLLAGRGLANSDRILQTVDGMLFVRGDVENILKSLGVTPAKAGAAPAVPEGEVEKPCPVVYPGRGRGTRAGGGRRGAARGRRQEEERERPRRVLGGGGRKDRQPPDQSGCDHVCRCSKTGVETRRGAHQDDRSVAVDGSSEEEVIELPVIQ